MRAVDMCVVDVDVDVICFFPRSVHVEPAEVAVVSHLAELRSIFASARSMCTFAGSLAGAAVPAAPLQRASGGGAQARPPPSLDPPVPPCV